MSQKILLNEINASSDDRIKDAINRVLRVRITYDDKKPHVISKRKGKNTRYILPVAYGLTKSGKKAIRAYQTAGSTKRGVPKWKLFLLDNIISWSNGSKTFKNYKDTLIKLGLNTNGDKGMTTIYAITPFANADVQVAKYDNDVTPEPINKDDVVPTTNSQKPDVNLRKKEPSILKTQPHSVDNVQQYDYNKDIESPDTKPITKIDVGIKPEQKPKNISNSSSVINNIEPVDNKPVEKTDIKNDDDNVSNEIDPKNSDFAKQFRDLSDRMNNLYNSEQ